MKKAPANSEIKGHSFQEARERLGISLQELAQRSCFSVHQIEQIKNGKSDAFYSLAIKAHAAKKIAELLNLSDADAFECKVKPTTTAKEVDSADTGPVTEDVSNANSLFSTLPSALGKQLEPRFTPDLDSSSSIDSMDRPARSRKFLLGGLVLAGIVFIGALIESGMLVQVQTWFYPKPAPALEIILPEEKERQATHGQVRTATDSTNSNSSASTSTTATGTAATAATNLPTNTPTTSSAVIPPAVTAVTATSVANTVEGCPSVGDTASSYTPTQSSRSADMVYVVSKVNQTVCVVDANGKIQNRSLDSGASASFYGKPPFKVMTGGLSQVDLFFQGWKVKPSNPNDKAIELFPTMNAAPTTTTSPAPASNASNPSN